MSSRYVLKKLNKNTYMIFDKTRSTSAYILYLTKFQKHRVHIGLAEIEDSGVFSRFVSIKSELWSTTIEVSNLINLLHSVSKVTEDPSFDIDNPVGLVMAYGGYLHGTEVILPKPVSGYSRLLH